MNSAERYEAISKIIYDEAMRQVVTWRFALDGLREEFAIIATADTIAAHSTSRILALDRSVNSPAMAEVLEANWL
jgi:hypothetical protein